MDNISSVGVRSYYYGADELKLCMSFYFDERNRQQRNRKNGEWNGRRKNINKLMMLRLTAMQPLVPISFLPTVGIIFYSPAKLFW